MAKLQSKVLVSIWIISGGVAMLSVLQLMGICDDGGPCVALSVFTVLGFGGTVLSAMVTNLHDPNLILAVLFNWILFALIAIGVTKLRMRLKGEPLHEN